MFVFGSGTLICLPFGANAAGNPTPLQVATMQEVSVDIQAGQKELYGKNQFPVAIARTAGKIMCKAKFATLYAKILNDLFFGNTVGTGETIGVIDEQHTPVTDIVTIVPPGSGTYAEDFGVREVSTGNQLTLVVSSPVTGVSYTRAGAAYTFADNNSKFISYSYLTTTGATVTVTNKPMGAMPTFEANLVNSQYGNNMKIRLPYCITSKITMGMKNEDFLIPEFDFSAFADPSGNIFYLDMDQ